MIAEATGEHDPPNSHRERLLAIAAGQAEADGLISVRGDIHENDAFIDGYCSGILNDLSEACRVAFELSRWRTNADSPHRPYGSLGPQFSVDEGANWSPLPARMFIEVQVPSGLPLTAETAAVVQELLDGSSTEPLAHNLLREALDVAFANPRSSLVIGVAAAEVGFKQLAVALVPGAAWLLDQAQSPPLPRMLAEFLPLLPAHEHIAGEVLAPPKYVRTLVHDGVEKRNRVAHAGRAPINSDALDELLVAIQDLLYLFDYYAGHAWALDNTSGRFRSQLGT
jgi:hypothetical protein